MTEMQKIDITIGACPFCKDGTKIAGFISEDKKLIINYCSCGCIGVSENNKVQWFENKI